MDIKSIELNGDKILVLVSVEFSKQEIEDLLCKTSQMAIQSKVVSVPTLLSKAASCFLTPRK